jgi:limonene 1,2-monooxygenase
VHVLGRPGAEHVDDAWQLLDQTTGHGATGAGAAVVGTPDDLVAAIRNLLDATGGFGCVLGFAHDWANAEATTRSWDLVARYVMPEVNGMLRNLRGSAQHVHDNKTTLMAGASAAVLAKIMENERAAEALAVMLGQRQAKATGFRPGVDVTGAADQA